VSLSGAGVYDEISSNITMWDWGALSAGVNNLRVYGNRLLRVWTYHFPDDVYGYTQKFSPFARDVYGIYTLANFDLSATGMYYDEWKERLNDGLLEASLGGEGQDDVMIMLTLFSKHDLQDDFTRSPWKASNNDTGASGVAVINSDSGFPYVYNIRLDMTPTTQTPTATPA